MSSLEFWKLQWDRMTISTDVASIHNNKKLVTARSLPTIRLESEAFSKLPIKEEILIRFKVSGELNPHWINDPEYRIEISSKSTDIIFTTKKWSSENGWVLLTKIRKDSIGKVTIDVKVEKQESNSIVIEFFNSKDVFQKFRKDRLIDELNYIKPFADNNIAPEYDENYCMQAAERGISELLGDYVNFYSVERDSHKHKNSISFAGKTALTRGSIFEKNGFASKVHRFKLFKIDQDKRNYLNDSNSNEIALSRYKEISYDFVIIEDGDKRIIEDTFTNDLNVKELGYHVYYFTVTNGFHTLLLLIDTISKPDTPSYEIWDQHGKTSSFGALNDIVEGIRRQTSWTSANSCLNRFYNGKTKHYDSLLCTLWKIQRRS
jgi:hypothetical protein